MFSNSTQESFDSVSPNIGHAHLHVNGIM